MQRLAVCAIAINDVRDFFRADDELAARLRAIAAERFAPPTRPKRRLFPPLTKRDPVPLISPNLPDGADLSCLLSGGFVAPERLGPSWLLVTAWLEELSKKHDYVVWDDAAFNTLEWELARAGLGSDYSLHSLAERPLGLPLQPLPGQVAGYAKHLHVAEAYPALKDAASKADLTDAERAFLDPLLAVVKTAATSKDLDVIIIAAE